MSDPKKVYWDSSCFICFLNRNDVDKERRLICEDVLRHARDGEIEIYTSVFTIAEVIRPKRHGSAPMPDWMAMAATAIKEEHPKALQELTTLWTRYQAAEPTTKLTQAQIDKIGLMFKWKWVKLINLDERIADKAVELARNCGLRPADSVHAASAIARRVDSLQNWDRDYGKVAHLILVEYPQRISRQNSLFETAIPIAPTPEDFEETKGRSAIKETE